MHPNPEDQYLAQLIYYDDISDDSLLVGIFETPHHAYQEAQRIHQLDPDSTRFQMYYTKINQGLWDLDYSDIPTSFFIINDPTSTINLKPHQFDFDSMLIQLTANNINHDTVLQSLAKTAKITTEKTKLQLAKNLTIHYTWDGHNDLLVSQINKFIIKPVPVHIQEIREQLQS